MAKMIPLNPAPTVALPAEDWTLVATEAGRYSPGLKATVHARNGTLQTPGQLLLAHPTKWAPFVRRVAKRSGCTPEAIRAAISDPTEAIEVVLRPKPRPQPNVRAATSRPQIQVNARFDREIIADALNVLVGVNDPPTLFVRGTELCPGGPRQARGGAVRRPEAAGTRG